MEFELELDFSRVNPLRANVSVTDSQLRQKERAAFLNDSDPLSANRSALVDTPYTHFVFRVETGPLLHAVGQEEEIDSRDAGASLRSRKKWPGPAR